VYVNDHPFPTWQGVAYALYREDHLQELEVVLKKYLKGESSMGCNNCLSKIFIVVLD
jgi:hypothetical protein